MTVTLLAHEHDHAVIQVEDDIDDRELDRLRHLVSAILRGGVPSFVIDVAGARCPDLRLVRLLHRLQDRVGGRGGCVELRGLGPTTVPTWDGLTLSEAFALYIWGGGDRRDYPTVPDTVVVPQVMASGRAEPSRYR